MQMLASAWGGRMLLETCIFGAGKDGQRKESGRVARSNGRGGRTHRRRYRTEADQDDTPPEGWLSTRSGPGAHRQPHSHILRRRASKKRSARAEERSRLRGKENLAAPKASRGRRAEDRETRDCDLPCLAAAMARWPSPSRLSGWFLECHCQAESTHQGHRTTRRYMLRSYAHLTGDIS